jgi:1-phosphatidylinositol-4-phosphate 5-kinase
MMSIRSDLTLREILSAGKDTRVIPVSTDDRLVIGIVPKSEKKVKRLIFRVVLLV